MEDSGVGENHFPQQRSNEQRNKTTVKEEMAIAGNLCYPGDCLSQLTDIVARHGAFADLVYLDPPFNSDQWYNYVYRGMERTKQETTAFKDTWRWTGAAQRGFEKFVEEESPKSPAADLLVGMRTLLEKRDKFTLAYLTYMTRRLSRIRDAMTPTASIYLHCDPVASHYLKLVMDAIFGRKNFRREIVWTKQNMGGFKTQFRNWTRMHDTILYYTMSPNFVFNKKFSPLPKETVKAYNKKDEHGWWTPYPEGRRKYLHENPGIPLTDSWSDIPDIIYANKEKMGFSTQKPIALLRRIVEVSSNPGDIVLDPFFGCGTSIAACHETKRRFVGIDIAPSALQVTEWRMNKHYPGFGDITVGDNVPQTPEEWNRKLPEEDLDEETPEWAIFQYNAVKAIPKAWQPAKDPREVAERGADGGIDGRIKIVNPKTGLEDNVIIQVKRKKQPGVEDVENVRTTLDSTNAFMGLLITLNEPTKRMKNLARLPMRSFVEGGKEYPRVAILRYDQVLAGEYKDKIPYDFAVSLTGEVSGAQKMAAAQYKAASSAS